MTAKKITPIDALISSTVNPNLVWLEKLWPVDLQAFDAERFEAQAKRAVLRNNALLHCDPSSLLDALLRASELGLDPSGTLGRAWLSADGGRVHLVIGYQGLVDLALRTGAMRSVEAWLVRERDGFAYTAGAPPKHQPYIPRPDEDPLPGKVWCAWAMALMANGTKKVDVMSLRELEAGRAGRLRARGTGEEDVAELYKRIVLLRMLATIPLGTSRIRGLAKAMEMEDGLEEPLKQLHDTAPRPVKGAGGISALLGIEEQ